MATEVDTIFVIDSSSSISNEVYAEFMDALADAIMESYPAEDSTLGLVM